MRVRMGGLGFRGRGKGVEANKRMFVMIRRKCDHLLWLQTSRDKGGPKTLQHTVIGRYEMLRNTQ